MGKNEQKPAIRFQGFTDAWEQRKFSDFAQRESAFRASSSEYPSVEYEDVVAEEGRLNKDVRQKETQKTGIIFDGTQVLYGKLRPYLHNWLNPDFSGVAVGDWWVLRPVGVDKKFLYRLIQTQRFDEVANQSSGSKMPRADWNLVSNTEFIIPSSLDEQRQVAETFDDLDDLITLHQCKYLMFPAFSQINKSLSDTLSWEQRKLSDLVDVCSGRDYKHLSEGTIPVYGTGGYMLSVSEALSYDRDAIGIGRKGTIDKPYVLKAPFWTVDTLFYAVPKHPECLDFIHDIFQIIDWKKKDESTGVPSLSKEAINDTDVMVPKIDEQLITGDVFARIDNLITLHQREQIFINLEVHDVRSGKKHRFIL